MPKFNSDAWKRLKKFMLESTPDVKDKILHVCDNCWCSLNSNALPAQCILNGLLTDPVPKELSKLNSLETQLIQRAKPFQTIVRLGTYTVYVTV